MSDPRYVYRPMLDLIGFTEGTDKGDGYNETLAYGKLTGGDVNLVSMTLDEIDALQTRMLRHPNNRWNSSAIGRYQIVRKTLRSIRQRKKLSGNALYDEAMQDELGCFLLGARGIDKWLEGRVRESALINNLAREWASLPTTEDRGHYSGQSARVDSDRVRAVLAQVRERYEGREREEGSGQDVDQWTGDLEAIRRVAAGYSVAEIDQMINALQVARFLNSQAGAPQHFNPHLSLEPPDRRTNPMSGKPFWQSRTLWGIAIVALSQFSPAVAALLEATGVGPALDPATTTAVQTGVEQIMTGIGAVLALFGRIRADRPLSVK